MSTEVAVSDQIAEWREDLKQLFANVREWAGEMQPPPAITSQPVTLNERNSGKYTVDELILERDGHRMNVRPIAPGCSALTAGSTSKGSRGR